MTTLPSAYKGLSSYAIVQLIGRGRFSVYQKL
jgi:hypothetical protein